jgi:hypothetical protein
VKSNEATGVVVGIVVVVVFAVNTGAARTMVA